MPKPVVTYQCTLCPREWTAVLVGGWEAWAHCKACDRHSARPMKGR